MANALVRTSANEFIRMPELCPAGVCSLLSHRISNSGSQPMKFSRSRFPQRNRCRRHCHSRSVLCLLEPNGSDRVDGDKLCALLVGSRRDP